MDSILSKLSISKRISLAAGLPLLALLVMSLIILNWNWKSYSDSKFLTEIVGAVSELSDVVHVLQIERGLTAGYVAKGGPVPEKLSKARADVDVEIKNYHAMVEHLREVTDAKIVSALAGVDQKFEGINDFRSQIDSGSVELSDAMKYYSAMIQRIMSIGLNSAELAYDAKVALEIIALIELGEAKEYAGKERGLVNGVLSGGMFSKQQFIVFNQHIARQGLMIENFIAAEPEIHREEYRLLLENTGEAEVQALRDKLVDAGSGTLLTGVNAKEWFETTTNRINKLREIELKAAGDIISETAAMNSANFYAMVTNALINLVLITMVLTGMFMVSRSITRPLTQLSDAMGEISDGNLDVKVSGDQLSDEIGAMSRALKVFRDGAVEKVKLESEAENTRSQSEKERGEREAQKAREAASLNHSVDLLGAALDKLASGDLSIQIDEAFDDGIDSLRVNFNSAVTRLADTFQQIKISIDTISTGADEMKTASAELSSRTEQQAHSLQDVSAAVEEITRAVDGSAEDSASASSLAAAVSNETANSLTVVNDAVESINRIDQASKEIASIIGVIDEITFQTNLLALNAGVEAARAGDAGKGFAVVAQEVRELAHRSASSANEIKDLIQASNKEVEGGVKLVTAAGNALNTISQQVEEITSSVQSIASASKQQSSSLNDCSQSAGNLDRSTQQNAAMAEQATAVMQNLARDSKLLLELVDRFTLPQGNDVSAKRAA